MDSKRLKWVFLIILALIWGSSFILIKKGLLGLSPLQLGSLRILFAAIFLLIIGFKSLSKIPLMRWKYIALTAILGTFVPVYLFAIAQTQINSTVSSILNSLTPLNTLIVGVFAFGLSFNRAQILGIIIGFAGTLVLIVDGVLDSSSQNYGYTILVLAASLCYAVNVNLVKKYLSDLSPMSICTANFLVLLLPASLVLVFSDFFEVISLENTTNSVLYILVLGIVGTGIANLIFFKLIQISSPVFATSVTYLIPVVAFGWGILDNETLTLVQFLGACIIFLGVYLSAKKE